MSSDHKSIYQDEWDNYAAKQGAGCIFPILIFLFVIIGEGFLPESIRPWINQYGVFIFVPVFLAVAIYSQMHRFKCPRCKQPFHPFRQAFRESDTCINCGLPIYYGSDRFYDYWGTERGEALIKEVKEYEKTPQ
jgi:hypothetical protein